MDPFQYFYVVNSFTMSVCVSMVWNGGLYVIPNVWMSEDNYIDLALSFYLYVSLSVLRHFAVQAGHLSYAASASTH